MKKTRYSTSIARLTAAVLAITIIAGVAPAMASGVRGSSATWRSSFAPKLVASQTWAEKKVATPAKTATALAKATVMKDAPVPEPEPVRYASTASNTSGSTSGSTATSAASKASSSSKRSSGSELAQAQSILAGLISKYSILAGTTVSFGDAQGHQAICYYQSGRIVISTGHTASLSTILNHEVWHVIDWRDNGQIDWGENVPPK